MPRWVKKYDTENGSSGRTGLGREVAGSLFITGAGGFIGRRLLGRLSSRKYENLYCLTRSTRTASTLNDHQNVKWLVGDIFDSSVYGACLEHADAVVHLAATTGKAGRDQYFKVNSVGTQHLLAQCRQYGVKNFLYVSSIVVKYLNKSRYYYAQSKEEAEKAVVESGLNYTIVRPTIVLGKDSSGWKSLSKLARLPLPVVLGDGSARIQPIDVDDLAEGLLSVVEHQDFGNKTYDLGGPDIISVEGFVRKVHRAYYGKESGLKW